MLGVEVLGETFQVKLHKEGIRAVANYCTLSCRQNTGGLVGLKTHQTVL